MTAVFLVVAFWLSGMGFAPPGTPGRPLPAWFIALGVAALVVPTFLGGGLWGWGMAYLFERPTRPAIRTGALAFGGMVLLTALPTDLSQLWLDDLPGWMPLGVHGYFTIVFMVEVGIVGLIATWRLAKRLGAGRRAWSVGLWTGAGSAAGFLLGSMVALAAGFRIFPWERFSMVWAFLISLPFSTLAAGGAMGWRLQHSSPSQLSRSSGYGGSLQAT